MGASGLHVARSEVCLFATQKTIINFIIDARLFASALKANKPAWPQAAAGSSELS